jgi:putative ABC transport system permease protein
MLFFQMLNEAWISIKSNKLRSFLTVLGILIGVAAVVLMVATGQAVQIEINKQLESLGGNKLIIVPASTKTGGIHTGRTRSTTTYKDCLAIKKIRNVVNVAPLIRLSATVFFGGNNWRTSIVGTDTDYFIVNADELEKGTFFSEEDVENGNNFAVIGKTVVDNLFLEGEEPLGSVIRIKNVPYTVIGVLKEKGSAANGSDQDDTIVLPLFSAKRKLTSNKFPDLVAMVIFTADEEKNLPFVESRVETLLRERHNLSETKEDDFDVLNLKEIADKINSIGVILSILLLSIASISLFVGSIGIMNMMLVSVTERTREIGIRKAIGAKEKNILIQFLFESILISLAGSMIGMSLGIILSQVGGHILAKEVPISFITIIISIFIAFAVGIISGIVPAMKATKLDPIDALRYQ